MQPMPSDEPQIELSGVRKVFSDRARRGHDVVAVEGADLTVADGELFAILGPSGSGKTTVLRMIAGFEQPTAGTIRLGGTDVTELPARHRDVNTVFQDYALFPHMTVLQNVEYGLKVSGVRKAERRQRAAEALDMVRLGDHGPRRPTQLSGGQRQRVALARALVGRPRVLLLDEPLGALDLKLRKQMQVELKRIQQEVGITFIYVTHDQEEAMTMSDRIAVMNNGRYEQLGEPEVLYERPTTRFVAGFLGVSNLLPGSVEGNDGSYAAVRLGDDTRLRAPRALVGDSPRVSIGVRPEKIRLHADSAEPVVGHNHMSGVVRDASYLGVSTQYLVETRGGAMIMVYEQNVERATKAELWAPGEAVQLTWSPDHTFVVPSEPIPAEAPTAATAATNPAATPVARAS
jgi:putative spermidine/putrescine transport system ATP-binding protein